MVLKKEKANIVIRQCQAEDVDKLFPLFKEAYKYNPRMQERDFFEWQFRNTPFAQDAEYSFLVACDGDEINGFLGYIPIQFRFANNIHLGCFSYNWYSVGNNRSGIKLLSELMIKYDNVFYLGCTADSEAIFKVYQMPMDYLPRWVAVINEEKVADLFGIKNDSNGGQIRKSCEMLTSLNGDSSEIYSCDRFDANEEFFFDGWKSIKGFCRRTGRYLNWRYVDIPRHDYKIIRGRDDQFAVYRIETIKNHLHSVIRIVEWNFHGPLAQKAFAYILNEGRQRGSILVDFFCTATELGKSLEEFGFFRSDNGAQGVPYLFRPIHYTRDILMAIDLPPHRVERNFDFAQWYITKGDSDMDRIKL